MLLTTRLTAVIAFCACATAAAAQPADKPDEATAAPPAAAAAPAAPPAAAPAAPPAAAAAATPAPAAPVAFQLNGTTWTFTDKDGMNVQESIDAKGNYIANSAEGKHLDHGTSVMKGDKACFTSAMDKKGEICWTTKAVEIGQSMETTSDKGEKLTVTRVAYVPLEMPK